MSINFSELRELLAAIAHTDIAEVALKTETFELNVRRDATTTAVPSLPMTTDVVSPPSVPTVTKTPQTPEAPPSSPEKRWVPITSPMVGTFYRAPAPDEPPFVDRGDRVTNTQTVCIIEAMKLMNEIEAEVAGEVMEIAVTNGEPVEYGQTLMWVNPS